MNRNMSKFVFSGTLCLAVLLTGCGGEYAGVNRAVSDSAVSGGAVSENAVRGESNEDANKKESQQTAKTETKKYRHSTDTNMYYGDFNSDAIMQVRRDGTHKKEIFSVQEGEDLVLEFVDENGMYCSAAIEEGGEGLYRFPIEKDEKGYDVVKKSEKEELIKDSFYSSCWDSHYVVYDNDEEIVRYDLQKKEVVSRQSVKEMENNLSDDTLWEFFRIQDCFVAIADEGGIYVQDTEDTDWKSCGDKKWVNAYYGLSAQTENSVFYEAEQGIENDLEDWSIWKCDGKKTSSFITMNQLKQAVEKAKGVGAADEVNLGLEWNIYGDSDRLYFQIGLNWKDGDVFRMEYLIFSQGEEESELRYEKELTECMQSHVKNRTGKWGLRDEEKGKMETVYKENVVVNDAQCVAIFNGNVYLSLYDYEKDKGRMGCYEIQSGNFRWISRGEAAYGELGCEGAYYDYEDDGGLDTVFDKEQDNGWIGVYGNNYEEIEGARFYETK